jgi:dihydrofolate synthase/folylpolyglutamate synthase
MSENSQASLDSWLQHIAAVHPREIELGLDRSRRVADRMHLTRPGRYVITVAGTNGKGSCVACLEAILQQAGYRTGAYTSPHMHCFNERFRVDGQSCGDEKLSAALALVESCRGADSLSYFEFATLAALWIFEQAQVDVALLEVGLGGRLDAVNIIDPDIAIITNISRDHEDWLGCGVENIGREKAGILRGNIPAILGSNNPPKSILDRAREVGAQVFMLEKDFKATLSISQAHWKWQGQGAGEIAFLLEALPVPRLALDNVAAALQAIKLLPLDVADSAIGLALESVALPGRFELRRDTVSGKLVVLDVAHNAAAAALLAVNLHCLRQQHPQIGRITGVIAVMADKEIEDMVVALESCLHIWYIAQINEARSMPSAEAEKRVQKAAGTVQLRRFESVTTAYRAACDADGAGEQELILVTGSFHTVAAVRNLTQATDEYRPWQSHSR